MENSQNQTQPAKSNKTGGKGLKFWISIGCISLVGIVVMLLGMVYVFYLFFPMPEEASIKSGSTQADEKEKEIQANESQKEPEEAAEKDKTQIPDDTSKIQVTFDTQDIIDGKQKTVVWTQNDSENIFSGNLFARAKEFDDSTLGSDTFFVEGLLPGQKIFGILWSKPSVSASYEYKWSSADFKEDSSKSQSQLADAPYKLLKEKKESGGTLIPQIEFYLAADRNFDKMYEFLKSKQINKGIFYHAVFVDNEKYAEFSKYPITAMFFEGEQAKHIIATYWYNTQNGNREFTFYEKNSWESLAQTRKD